MKLGSTCPRFDKYGALYPDSAEVQTALCNYYAIIIRLCRYSIESSRKSGTWPRFVSAIPSIREGETSNATWQLPRGFWVPFTSLSNRILDAMLKTSRLTLKMSWTQWLWHPARHKAYRFPFKKRCSKNRKSRELLLLSSKTRCSKAAAATCRIWYEWMNVCAKMKRDRDFCVPFLLTGTKKFTTNFAKIAHQGRLSGSLTPIHFAHGELELWKEFGAPADVSS